MKVTDSGVPVDTLVGVVKEAVKRANVSRTSATTDLRVASVQLKLAVVATTSAGGGLSFRVPFIGMNLNASAKISAKDTHTIDITLYRHRNVPAAKSAAATLSKSWCRPSPPSAT